MDSPAIENILVYTLSENTGLIIYIYNHIYISFYFICTACSRGTFGADCSQTCHCANPSACNGMTGECTDGGGCEGHYHGVNCQVLLLYW